MEAHCTACASHQKRNERLGVDDAAHSPRHPPDDRPVHAQAQNPDAPRLRDIQRGANAGNKKAALAGGFDLVAGIGFEPMTFGL